MDSGIPCTPSRLRRQRSEPELWTARRGRMDPDALTPSRPNSPLAEQVPLPNQYSGRKLSSTHAPLRPKLDHVYYDEQRCSI
jgi:hypothetical protein